MPDKEAGPQVAAEIIAKAAATNSDTLDLSKMELSVVPQAVFKLRHLSSLDLSNNQIKTLPAAISSLQLEHLELSGNPLGKLPKPLFSVRSLRYLGLGDCGLHVLDPEIGRLRSLETLAITNNRVTGLPASFADLKALRRLVLDRNPLKHFPPEVLGLVDLEVLYAIGCGIASLPSAIHDLRGLEELYLNDNLLSELPNEIGDLSNLRSLFVEDNQLATIPPAIGRLRNLRTLTFASNNIVTLPVELESLANLQVLDVYSNSIEEVPRELGRLKSLEELYLSENMLQRLPPELHQLGRLKRIRFESNPLPAVYFDAVKQGADALRVLLRSLAEETRPLYEGKLLVTGEGQVGKSWALASLQGADPQKKIGEDNTTWGIDRGELRLRHPVVPEEEIHLNTWDFGGQRIYRVTHQFFFSENAIYILVWNPRQGAEQCRVKEWLRMIALRTGSTPADLDSAQNLLRPRAKVIMVATHARSEGGSYNPDYGFASLDDDLKRLIVDEVAVDSVTGHNIENLREVIARHAADLPDMGQPFNRRWAQARADVLALRQKKPWIDFDEFSHVCSKRGITDQDQLRTLAWTYLHSMGRAVWYGSPVHRDDILDEPLLEDTIVLDAVWLSRAFVQVLDDEETRASRGMLDHRRLPFIWTHHGRTGWHSYKPKEYEILKLVMRRFDVALPTRESNGTRSLVPQLVPHDAPRLPWDSATRAPGARTMRLACRLDYQATGLMPRLVAATEPWHVYEDGIGLFWERGIFLRDTASFDVEAIITITGFENPVVEVITSGDEPAFLMQELYKVLESTLGFWKGMTRTYFVGCPNRVVKVCDGRFKLEAILRRLRDRSDVGFACEECDSVWSPQQLIHGFEPLGLDSRYVLNHLYHRDQLLCPSIFLLEPAEKRLLRITTWSSLIGKRFKLTLLSELSGQKVGSAEFTFTRQWVSWVAPMARLASFALTGAALPISGDLATEFEEGANLLDKIGGLSGDLEVQSLELNAKVRDIHVSRDQRFNFSMFLAAIDLDPRSQGMDIAQAPDGRWLWMSSEEVKLYTPQPFANDGHTSKRSKRVRKTSPHAK